VLLDYSAPSWSIAGAQIPRGVSRTEKKLLILGIDGMDPELLQRFMGQGRMPTLPRSPRAGSFLPLQTSIPPQSPVAWANLITGMDQGVTASSILSIVILPPWTPYFSTSQVSRPSTTCGWELDNSPLGGGGVPFAAWQSLLAIPGRAGNSPDRFPSTIEFSARLQQR